MGGGVPVGRTGAVPPDDAGVGENPLELGKAGKPVAEDAGGEEGGLLLRQDMGWQDSPVVPNYRGYATRKLGRVDEGIGYYLKSVAADPSYAKVREYLGEAYMLKGRSDLAREQLAAIRAICGTGCEEYRDLEEAIAAPARG